MIAPRATEHVEMIDSCLDDLAAWPEDEAVRESRIEAIRSAVNGLQAILKEVYAPDGGTEDLERIVEFCEELRAIQRERPESADARFCGKAADVIEARATALANQVTAYKWLVDDMWDYFHDREERIDREMRNRLGENDLIRRGMALARSAPPASVLCPTCKGRGLMAQDDQTHDVCSTCLGAGSVPKEKVSG